MKKVKMRTRYAGPSGNCEPGGVILVEDGEAEGLLKGGFAEPATVTSPRAARPVETAAVSPGAEKAVKPAPKPRGKPKPEKDGQS